MVARRRNHADMGAGALRERRGVTPVSVFNEWGAGGDGRKHAHEFGGPEDDSLRIAGLREAGLARVTRW